MQRRISDVAPPGIELEGNEIKLRDLIGREFVIVDADTFQGEDGPYWSVKIELDGEPAFFFSSHKVVSKQLADAVDHLPVLATVEKQGSGAPGRDYFVLV